MDPSIELLGPPRVLVDGRHQGRPRGAKTWALLALLARSDGPVPRSRVAELLFSEADDPLGALRWTASQLRRLLAAPDTVAGDPLELGLPADAIVDVDVVLRGRREDALELPGLKVPRTRPCLSWAHLFGERSSIAAPRRPHDALLDAWRRLPLSLVTTTDEFSAPTR
jgi:hypothetical protein